MIWRWIIWWYFFFCLWELTSSLSTPNYYLCLTFWVSILLLPRLILCELLDGRSGSTSCFIMSYPFESFVKHFKICVNLRWKVWLNFILQSETATIFWFRTTWPLNFKLSDPHVLIPSSQIWFLFCSIDWLTNYSEPWIFASANYFCRLAENYSQFVFS